MTTKPLYVLENGIAEKYTAIGNEIMITYPFELHQLDAMAMNRNEFFAIQINIKKGCSLLGLNKEYSEILRNELCTLPHRHLKAGHTQISFLRAAFNFFAYGKPSETHIGVAHLVCFLFGLKYLEPVHQQNKQINNNMQNALSYISEHIESTILLEDLAKIAGYSLSHFKFKFKEQFGITPAEFITLQKINYAEKALVNSGISITELAHTLSFSSSNYFCTVFKKVLGMTPSEYRKSLKF